MQYHDYFMPGWSSHVESDSLTLYEVSCLNDSGPAVRKAIKVNSDFTWSVTYRRCMVSNEHNTLLQSLPSLINTNKTH